LRALQRATGAAFLMVTHDQAEALALADRIAVLDAGRIVQQGAPREVWDRPATRFVADFLGAANILIGTARADGGIDCPGLPALRHPATPHGSAAGAPAALALRIALDPAGDGIAAIVQAAAFRGGATLLTLRTDGGAMLRAAWPAAKGPAPGGRVGVAWDDAALVLLAP